MQLHSTHPAIDSTFAPSTPRRFRPQPVVFSPGRVVVVVPTYNEAENLPRLAAELLALPVSDLQVLVIDDHSPDGTGELADTLAAETGRVAVIHRAGKQGLGTAYVTGFRWALAHGADVIVQMDADFSHLPCYIPTLLERLDTADVVVGSRYVTGGKLDERWSLGRRLLSRWANDIWVRLILRTPIHDNTGGYRAWKRETLIGMDLNRVHSNGYVFQIEMTYVALRMDYQFREIPIYFADRRRGKSKMGLKVQLEAALRVLQIWWCHRRLDVSMRAEPETTKEFAAIRQA